MLDGFPASSRNEIEAMDCFRADLRDEMEERDMARVLREAVASLPTRQRFVIERYYLAGDLRNEVAKELGVSDARVTGISYQALPKLRQVLSRSFKSRFDLEEEYAEDQRRKEAWEQEKIREREEAKRPKPYDEWVRMELARLTEQQRKSWDWLADNVPAIHYQLIAKGYTRPTA